MKDTDTKVKNKLYLMRRKSINSMGTINSKNNFMHKFYVIAGKEGIWQVFLKN